MMGRRIAFYDLAQMFEFTMRTQLMIDKAWLRFSKKAIKFKSGYVNLPETVLWHRLKPGKNLINLFLDKTCWSSRLIKQSQYKRSELISAS